ncbi:hypothetical protein DFJ77DRAFT_446836 [Powellomyces hirtus]|nr:hypothetical protein DFJ77DRAFT_446836 [Powellomyces hirtus]
MSATPISSSAMLASIALFAYTMFHLGRLKTVKGRLLTLLFIGSFACIGNCYGLLWLLNLDSNPLQLVNAFETLCWFLMIQISTYLYCERVVIFAAPTKIRWVWIIQALILISQLVEGVVYQYESQVSKDFTVFYKTSIITTTITCLAEVILYMLLLRLVMQRFTPGSLMHSILRRKLLIAMAIVVAFDIAIWALGIANQLEAHLFIKPVAYQYRIGAALSFYGVLVDLLKDGTSVRAVRDAASDGRTTLSANMAILTTPSIKSSRFTLPHCHHQQSNSIGSAADLGPLPTELARNHRQQQQQPPLSGMDDALVNVNNTYNLALYPTSPSRRGSR